MKSELEPIKRKKPRFPGVEKVVEKWTYLRREGVLGRRVWGRCVDLQWTERATAEVTWLEMRSFWRACGVCKWNKHEAVPSVSTRTTSKLF